MKVLNVYNKNDLDLFTYNGQLITDIMDKFFLKFPNSYRVNYDKNLKTLELFRVDEMMGAFDSAEYCPESNVLIFKSFTAIPHELMHMASFNKKTNQFAFCRNGIYSLFEDSLVEGMTEYLSCIAKNGKPNAYFFEYFVISMLSSIDGIFEPFFIPSYNKFISLFPDKTNIHSLMYGLEFYHNKIKEIDDDTDDMEIDRIGVSVKNVIDSLIDIELSFKKEDKERKKYGDKFMDLISDYDVKALLEDVCPDYKNYAFHEVKKRILRRK